MSAIATFFGLDGIWELFVSHEGVAILVSCWGHYFSASLSDKYPQVYQSVEHVNSVEPPNPQPPGLLHLCSLLPLITEHTGITRRRQRGKNIWDVDVQLAISLLWASEGFCNKSLGNLTVAPGVCGCVCCPSLRVNGCSHVCSSTRSCCWCSLRWESG